MESPYLKRGVKAGFAVMDLSAGNVRNYLEELVYGQVESLFRRASFIFSEETQVETKGLKTLLYVGQMLRRFDPKAEVIGLEIQCCSYQCFLRVVWTFKNITVNYWWNGEGCSKVPEGWQFWIPAKMYDIYALSPVNSKVLDTKLTAEQLLTCWEHTRLSGVVSMLF